MSHVKANELGQLQIQLLKLLWKRGNGTVHDLLADWPTPDRPAYVTILTVLRRLEKRGLLAHDTRERSFVYRPLVSEQELQSDLLGDLVKRVFGSPSTLVTRLLDEEHMPVSELERIRQAVEAKARRSRGAE
jgi:BlaI family transcriptional regulator, penicillinase repressor